MAPPSVRPSDVADRWLALDDYTQKPMEAQLSGLELEYRIVLLYSRDRGRREAQLGASLGPGTEDIGFRNRAAVLFEVAPSRDFTLRVRDENGRPTVASFRHQGQSRARIPGAIQAPCAGLLFPGADLSRRWRNRAASRRRVYGDLRPRARVHTGDTCDHARRLGRPLRSTSSCGAGSIRRARAGTQATITSTPPAARTTRVRPKGVQPGGHDAPRAGRSAQRRFGAELGTELLSPAAVLRERRTTRSPHRSTLLRYDLEVSGFPSSHCGHLVLLRLRDQDYPGHAPDRGLAHVGSADL